MDRRIYYYEHGRGDGVEQLLQTYKALSEEMRLRIIMLLTHGELCVCDVMEILDESQPKVSRHLAYLKHSGLVKSKRVGTWMHYSLKEQLDSITAEHVRFLADHAGDFPRLREDVTKMEEVKRNKLCGGSFTVDRQMQATCDEDLSKHTGARRKLGS
jgi:ArsR family transcriptional regulator, arsenate/arsenite/antimonite-responsive transcriptional repressor